MAVYEVCNSTKRKCKSPETIENALKGSYMLVIDNSQDFIHYEEPGGAKMIRSLSYQKWYALSTNTRLDFPKKITISDIVWDSWRTGIIQNNKESEHIFDI